MGKLHDIDLALRRLSTPGMNVLRLASAMADGETVTVGGVIYEASYDNVVAAGRISINLSGYGTKSSGTLTATANPSAAEAVTVGAKTYTFRATLSATPNEVLIGATAEDSYNNLVAAITGAAGGGTLYSSTTVASTEVTAVEGTDVAASLTLTSDNTELTDGDTVTIGTTVYRFKDTPAQAYDVKRHGTTADTTLGNLRAAINASGTPGTEYFAGTLIHPTVSAGAVTAHAIVVTAKTAGAAGNLIATAEASSHLSWTGGGLFLTGGSDKTTITALVTGTGGDALATTETLANGSFGGSTLSGGANPSAGNGTDAFVAAANGSAYSLIQAVKIGTNEVLCYTKKVGANLASTETLAGSNNAWAASAFYGGSIASTPASLVGQKRVPTTQEVTLQTMHWVFGFTVLGAMIQVRDSAGTVKAVDGKLTYSGPRLDYTSDGSTDIAATDDVCVLAW